jgi:hypothetical protein
MHFFWSLENQIIDSLYHSDLLTMRDRSQVEASRGRVESISRLLPVESIGGRCSQYSFQLQSSRLMNIIRGFLPCQIQVVSSPIQVTLSLEVDVHSI